MLKTVSRNEHLGLRKSENPDLADVKNAVKHAKMIENQEISIFFENMDLNLSFGEGFDGIH